MCVGIAAAAGDILLLQCSSGTDTISASTRAPYVTTSMLSKRLVQEARAQRRQRTFRAGTRRRHLVAAHGARFQAAVVLCRLGPQCRKLPRRGAGVGSVGSNWRRTLALVPARLLHRCLVDNSTASEHCLLASRPTSPCCSRSELAQRPWPARQHLGLNDGKDWQPEIPCLG